jgi:DNA polymerase I-like protein with 3'-5' exonuclease and polymerase domains
MNVQNLGHGSPLRRCMTAPPGCKLIIADQAQIECRLTAYLAGQRDLIEAFAAGRDVYSELASSIFGRRIDKVTCPDERFAGKTAELSLQYGCGAERFAAMLRVKKARWHDFPFAKRTVDTYRASRSRIPLLWKNLDAHLSTTLCGRAGGTEDTYSRLLGTTTGFLAGPGRITLPSERSVTYPELGIDALHSGFSYRRYRNGRTTIWGGKMTENIVQACARDILTANHRELMKWCRIVLQVHDELVGVVHDEDAADAKAEFERVMSQRPWWAPDLPLNVEVKISDRYDK